MMKNEGGASSAKKQSDAPERPMHKGFGALHYDNILRMKTLHLSFIAVASLACLGARHALADEADVINFSASATKMQDNNLFRLRPGLSAESVGLKSRSDTITTTSLGVNFDKKLSLQRFIANANFQDSAYKTYDYLNYRGLNYDAKWQWAVGTRLSGDATFQKTQSLASYADYNNYIKRNLRTTQDNSLNLDYWLHSNWHLVGGANTTSLTNEAAFLEDSDYDGQGYYAGLRFQPGSGNQLTWRAKRMEGKYKKRQFNTLQQYDNGFSQTGQQVELYWQISGKSTVRASAEYINRQHDHFSSRDYSGLTGNIDYSLSVTGKTTLGAGYRRNLNPYQQVVSSYYKSDDIHLNAQWAATSKITTSAQTSYVIRDYQGAIVPLPANFPNREDKVARISLDVAYRPDRWLELKAGASFEKRLSNFSSYEYDDRVAYVSATGRF